MTRHTSGQALPRVQLLAERALATFERFTHIQAASGVILLLAAATALIWANSPLAPSYHALWHTPLSIGLGELTFSQPLHFWINDALMTVFFLVVGMEVRREIHEGSLSSLRQAGLPIAAALGGVILPAIFYLLFNDTAPRQDGWAVPTATDIAFALGLLALLGRSIPVNVRVFLLALAIIDDIVAVLIIALFYSGGLDYSGFLVAGAGLLLVLGLQKMGIGTAYAYILPGAILWVGLLMTGAHPTLAGVVLGLMTPVIPIRMRERPLDMLTRLAGELTGRASSASNDIEHMSEHLRQLRLAQRELLPPVVRMQSVLHPWVAFGIMPLFALANAGISVEGMQLSADGALWVTTGIMFALVAGKPLGIIGMSWLVVRLGWCALPAGVSWAGIWLVGLFAGVGFTMSMFIAMLAFSDPNLLGAAKLGVLTGSVLSAVLGLTWGAIMVRRLRGTASPVPAESY
ncbi:Na+/H+ antiporter NhaA [Pseudomonas sp. MYb185]|uniref:Na+/H+ antiporter NhaA n=1 Tax=Pseudomonas sp. MYb185 TaxID=1848729 RepID=UPI000CFC7217|nr:Na+/H+ antiporter NhaA [Pseudomonas sp. MYb185]PRB80926.1 Na+/H+ antiporter NhaA [Pseudomonas sp. MYb185]